ncbi:MAG: phosphoribosylformylglycinamidine synthase [Clostridium sp.]|jgi:phosphoribosylformylglycinamidine synthase|nr:phosphoribosylformylglycinamidine synthase [Clostridium sp.]
MGKVRRIYVEKKAPFAVKAKELKEELRSYLRLEGVEGVRRFLRYDVENISEEVFARACRSVFCEPPVDDCYEEHLPVPDTSRRFTVEYLPGQFDQRADSAAQCIQLLDEREEPLIRTAETYVLEGKLTEEQFSEIKAYCINPVDSREAQETKPDTLAADFEEPPDIAVFQGFCKMEERELEKLYVSLGLAMTFRDFLHIRKYFRDEEARDPSATEIRVLDTYWSDHCRHTTFSTELKEVEFEEGYYRTPIETAYQSYLDTRAELYADRPDKYVCLMDLALMGMKKLKDEGKLKDLEESEEINACSVVVPIEADYGSGKVTEEWLVFFKNETHNHPTEIEPFGGAATCLGGAIRDPLSGRGYVYQAMRVTGAADPTVPAEETLRGKLPQKKLVRGAAQGYSSYGNQIGLATGFVKEIYHPAYVAKRMEIGAVLGAAPRENVVRASSEPGDVVILLGGRTGRDGCGGATGSSKAHTEDSLETCGAQVQKGNALTERKIQRLFRRREASRLIKKCNDFGAGGVSVAIGELAAGLEVDLDRVPKKYAGLDGTELAISESQERMAVVVEPQNVTAFLAFADSENLEAVPVARVTRKPRLVLTWRGRKIVDLSRAFLDTNGARQETRVKVEIPSREENVLEKWAVEETGKRLEAGDVKGAWLALLKDLNVCSQKGLVEMFDSTIGAASVLLPYGGRYQLTETQVMAAVLPLLRGQTQAATLMSYGFDPYLSSWSPYHGAVYAVLESVAKIVAAGGDYRRIRFTFQEYFRRMTAEPSRWSQPFASLLGAYDAQIGFGLPSIGGKDSMSGTFQGLDVPPTLVSFAVQVTECGRVLTPELKYPGSRVVRFPVKKDEFSIPKYEQVKKLYREIQELIQEGMIVSAYALDSKGAAAAVSKMAFGNRLGVAFGEDVKGDDLFENALGDIVAEIPGRRWEDFVKQESQAVLLGVVTEEPAFVYGDTKLLLEEALEAWTGRLDKVFPAKAAPESGLDSEGGSDRKDGCYEAKRFFVCKRKTARPTVLIPVFPGTNCEYDSARAFERAGAQVNTLVFRNLTARGILDSVEEFERAIGQAQILMFPGGFSAGDEPDGSAKFFATAFGNAKLKEATRKLLEERDGLILGICNGFQALIKLGLVPYGRITGQREDSPTLTYNTVNRHISRLVHTKVVSGQSPWLMKAELGAVYTDAVSHGEGRFVAPEKELERLFRNGQVATRYADLDGNVSMDPEYNVNGSYQAVEGITSPDGRVFGKMAHCERRAPYVAINHCRYAQSDLKIFEAGVEYFQ